MKNTDRLFLGEGAVFPSDPEVSGINANTLVVGGTGTGKSMSIAAPLLINNRHHSMIIPISKRKILTSCKPVLEEHGYNVQVIDLDDGKLSTVGFNIFDYIKNDQDCMDFAKSISSDCAIKDDAYWENSVADSISAMLYILLLNSKLTGRTPTLETLHLLFRALSTRNSGINDIKGTTLDPLFDKAEELFPDNYASGAWRTYSRVAEKTASCIFSMISTCLAPIFTDTVIKASCLPSLNIASIGSRKTALFILTSTFDKAKNTYVNIIYSTILRVLMKTAEASRSNRLKVPVQIIFDDFACGTRIKDFDAYISIFRSAGISAIMLLQSEKQLFDIYGEYGADTILDNCDNYVYLGGNNTHTCEHISRRIDKPFKDIMNLELRHVIVIRRGMKPFVTERYKIFEDPMCPRSLRG